MLVCASTFGEISSIRRSSSECMFFETGRYGSSVNKNKLAAGIAIKILYDMAAARTFKPSRFICRRKKINTSYSGNPLKPGKIIFLLFSLMNVTGLEVNINLSSLVKYLVLFFFFLLYAFCLMLSAFYFLLFIKLSNACWYNLAYCWCSAKLLLKWL